MEPVMQFCLQIEHAPLIAPPLNFLHPIAISLGHAKSYKTERVFREASVTEPIAVMQPPNLYR